MQSEISGRILMIRATKKVIFNLEQCPTFLQSKGLKYVSDNTCYAGMYCTCYTLHLDAIVDDMQANKIHRDI